MTQTAELTDEEIALQLETAWKAVLGLSPNDLLSPKRLKPLFFLSPYLRARPWKVEMLVDARRRVIAQRAAIEMLDNLQETNDCFIKNGSALNLPFYTAKVPGLLAEYDQLEPDPFQMRNPIHYKEDW